MAAPLVLDRRRFPTIVSLEHLSRIVTAYRAVSLARVMVPGGLRVEA